MRDRIVAVSAAVLLTMAAPGCTARIDQQALRSALIEADRQFASATAERGVEGWVSCFAEDGTMFLKSGLVQGRDAIRDHMAPFFADPGNTLTWEPTGATVAASGDLGYTIGRWESTTRKPEERTSVSARGSYVTIWRRDPGGDWEILVDIGNEDAPVSPSSGQPPE